MKRASSNTDRSGSSAKKQTPLRQASADGRRIKALERDQTQSRAAAAKSSSEIKDLKADQKKSRSAATRSASKIKGLMADQTRSRVASAQSAKMLDHLQEQQNLLELQNEHLGEAMAALEHSEHRYANLYDEAPVGYLTLDSKGRVREMNQTAGLMLGCTAAHLIGSPLLPHIAAEDRKVFLKHLWESQRSKSQVIATLRLPTKTGEERLVQFVTSRSHDPDGGNELCRTAITDITSQRHAETALSVSEAKFRLLAENMGEVFWFMELDPPRVTYVSPAFERIWGMPVSVIYGDNQAWSKAIHPDDVEAVHAGFHRWVEGESEGFHMEYRVVHGDGTIRWISDRGIVIGRKDGRPHELSGIASDITERKQAEAERSLLASVVESSDDAIITKDLDGIIRTWNAGAERVFGYTAAEAVGKPVTMLIPPDSEDDEATLLRRVRMNERIHHYETRRRCKDGRIIDVSLSISPLRENVGRIIGASKIARDITEQRRAELKFHGLLEAAPDAMVIVNGAGFIELVNAQALRMFGYERHEMVGQVVELLVPEPLREQHVQHRNSFLAAPLSGRHQRALELHGRCKDGGEFPTEITLSPLNTGDGILVISAIRDMTDRKQAEIKFRGLLESAPDAMIIVNQAGIIELVNTQAIMLFGYTQDELIGQPPEMLVPERFRRHHSSHRAGYAVNPHPRAMGHGRELFGLRKDGSEFATEISLSPLETPAGTLIISAVRDITERKVAEQALRDSELRFRGFFENAGVGTAIMSADGRFTLVNDRYCAITGYSREEMLGGMGPEDLDHPHDFGLNHDRLTRYLAGDPSTYPAEKRYLRKDGQVVWVHISATPMLRGDGKLDYTVGVIEDITERKLAEQALREAQRFAQSTLEAIPASLAVLDETGTIISTNEAWNDFALSNGALPHLVGTGANYLDVCEAAAREGIEESARFAKGIHDLLNGTCRRASVEYPCHGPNEERWFIAYATSMPVAGPPRVVIAHVDITETKLAEAELLANEERLRLFVEHTPAPVVMFDQEMRYLVVSKRWAQDFRLKTQDLLGRLHYEVFPDTPEKWKRIHQRCLAGATEACERDQFPKADGTVDWVKWEIRPWHDAKGAVGGIIIFAEVINERVRIEDQIRQLNEKLEDRVAQRTADLRIANEDLRAAIAMRRQLEEEILQISEREQQRIGQDLHDDLGQQLAGIWCLSSALQLNLDASRSPDAAGAHEITDLLKKALALTRALARGLHPVALDSGGFIAALDELARRTSDMFKIRCHYQCPPEVDLENTTATHLYRIAQESVTNAVKHGNAKDVEIKLSSNPHQTVLSVRDNGSGMPPLDPRRQGMGLRIMNYRADIIGGHIEIQSNLQNGGGTTVTCSVPTSPPAPPTQPSYGQKNRTKSGIKAK